MGKTQYPALTDADRRDALAAAEYKCGRKAHILEKDIWVVATLRALFNASFAEHLIFKGGTSLSKVWKAIDRFSEDIDITYDIRVLEPDLVSSVGEDAIPTTRSQVKRWSNRIRKDLPCWVGDVARPKIQEALSDAGFEAQYRAESERLYIRYEPLFEASVIVRPEVMVEFGARSTGEPHVVYLVECDIAAHLPEIAFPQTPVTVMRAERTFWEKATAIHVYCRQERRCGGRMSRHWYDLACLDKVGIATKAIADTDLANSVARHKSMFFSEKDASGERIDYKAAVSGNLQLVPSGDARKILGHDYDKMIADGMLLGNSESFDALMTQCSLIQDKANSTRFP